MIPVEEETLNAVQLLLGDPKVQTASNYPQQARKMVFSHLREKAARLEAKLLLPDISRMSDLYRQIYRPGLLMQNPRANIIYNPRLIP